MSKTKVADVRREVTTEGRQEIATMSAKLTKYTGRSSREVRPQLERSETAARGTRGDEERKRRKRKRSAAGRRKGERSEMKKRTEAGAAAKKGA